MPRDLPLGNGSLLVNFDAYYHLRDVYFPHVGKENHTMGSLNRVGMWVDGQFAWLSDWELALRYQPDTLVTEVEARHPGLGLRCVANDAVDCDANILVRRFTLHDERGVERRVRLFAHFDPYLKESAFGNAAYYDGVHGALVFYKDDRYFLLASQPTLQSYAVGVKGRDQMQGTWRDAEDGHLSNHPVSTGLVDGTLMVELTVPAHGETVAYVWLAAGQTLEEVVAHHELARGAPGALIDRTARYWRFWLSRARQDFDDLSPAVADQYRRSLLIIRTQIDHGGAILAANDSDISGFGMDHYSYVWPRDAALVAEALDLAGYHEAPRHFYQYLQRVLTQANHTFKGYLLQRYTPDGLVAATWHPSVGNGRLSLPIQEDQTALVVYGLCRHVALTGDVELVRNLYWDLIRPAADFLLVYRDPLTGLPHPSHDLWEEKYGIFLFTCSTVYGALNAAAGLAAALDDEKAARAYQDGAAEIRAGVEKYFYASELERFVFMVQPTLEGAFQQDPLLDSSMAAVFIFGMLPADDPRVVRMMQALHRHLQNRPPVGGIARHGDDYYHHLNGNYQDYPGNTWFVSTLWVADWHTLRGDPTAARAWIEWCVERALPSGVMAEQLHPITGAPLSVAPLTWSHAAFVASVERYLRAGYRHLDAGEPQMARQMDPRLAMNGPADVPASLQMG